MPPRHFKRPARVDPESPPVQAPGHRGDGDEWLFVLSNLPPLSHEVLEDVLREVSQEVGILEAADGYAVVKVVTRRQADELVDRLEGKYLGQGCYVKVSPTSRDKPHEILREEQASRSEIPRDIQLVRRIHATVERVRKHGPQFEMALMKEQMSNEEFAFLFPHSGAPHAYYRWLMYMLNDDSYICELGPLSTTTTRPTSIQVEQRVSKVWEPPESFPPGLEQELYRLDKEQPASNSLPVLGQTLRHHLDLLLRHASTRRGSIARITAFAHQYDRCALEIVQVLVASIGSALSPPNRSLIVARLWAIGDILANSGVSHPYRRELLHQGRLDAVFDEIREAADSMPRISGERLRNQVVALLASWRQNPQIVFTNRDLVAVREVTRRFASYDGDEFSASDHEYYDSLLSTAT